MFDHKSDRLRGTYIVIIRVSSSITKQNMVLEGISRITKFVQSMFSPIYNPRSQTCFTVTSE